MTDRPVPLLGNISLELVQRIEHALDGGYAATRIAGLAGELQQRSGRPSHRVRIAGLLQGDGVADQVKQLQEAAQSGEEQTFAADITKALDLQKVVITALRVVETAGVPDCYAYDLALAESPPLPPPAQISGFGGLDDFGLGDLGFDTSLLGELRGAVGEIAGAVESALDVVQQLGALANVGDLGNLGSFMQPMQTAIDNAGGIGTQLGQATGGLAKVFTT